MAVIERKNFDSPDDVMKYGEKMKVEVITIGGFTFQRVTAEPGWQWSKHLKPVVKTESCQKHHLLYMISGRLLVRMDNGKEKEYGPGDVGVIPPGHDGWTVGNKPAVWLEIPH
jgi:quercetin dioxygenase-like cupin family protein